MKMNRLMVNIIVVLWGAWSFNLHGMDIALAYTALSTSYHPNVRAYMAKKWDVHECQTDLEAANKRMTSPWIRKLAYEALKKCEHIYPEVVIIVNDENNVHNAMAGHIKLGAEMGRGINFKESVWSKEKYGVQRLILYHEAWHLVYRHYNRNGTSAKEVQAQEREADIQGAINGCCEQCACEYAGYYFKRFLAGGNASDASKEVMGAHVPKSLSEITGWAMSHLEKNIAKLEKKSLVFSATHPLDIERCLYLMKLAKTQLKGAVCMFHKAALSCLFAAPKQHLEILL